jgi:2,5-dihydroxypyridine 5,6-dioxygenase
LNLTFKRYLESAVRLTIENDYVTRIDGESLDAELMREYFSAWGDREAYAVLACRLGNESARALGRARDVRPA